MPETVPERHYRDRVQSVREIAFHKAARTLSRGDFEDLVALCLELATSGKQLLVGEYKRIFKEPSLTVAWLQERRQAIEELTTKYSEAVASLKDLAAGPAADSAPVPDIVVQLDQAVQSFVEAKQRVLERWPVGSPQEIAEARAGGRPEDYLDVDEAFAQIAGIDLETWRKRVEKRSGQG